MDYLLESSLLVEKTSQKEFSWTHFGGQIPCACFQVEKTSQKEFSWTQEAHCRILFSRSPVEKTSQKEFSWTHDGCRGRTCSPTGVEKTSQKEFSWTLKAPIPVKPQQVMKR